MKQLFITLSIFLSIVVLVMLDMAVATVVSYDCFPVSGITFLSLLDLNPLISALKESVLVFEGTLLYHFTIPLSYSWYVAAIRWKECSSVLLLTCCTRVS